MAIRSERQPGIGLLPPFQSLFIVRQDFDLIQFQRVAFFHAARVLHPEARPLQDIHIGARLAYMARVEFQKMPFAIILEPGEIGIVLRVGRPRACRQPDLPAAVFRRIRWPPGRNRFLLPPRKGAFLL